MKKTPLCRHCKIRVGEFCDAVVKDRKNGHYKYYTCNVCNTQRAKKYRVSNKNTINKAVKKYESKNSEKLVAWQKVNTALTLNKISKPSACQICGKCSRLDAHHNDYMKPLKVMWLCRKCHKNIHKK